ncbi:deoxyribonuclease IV [Bacillus sp. 31A1R]|uniref:Deoxyribonuclease IV n=1 Tax=Robertmurraya mangrovi TaxID=3098077 RepID=A0ABU5J3G2_9BACI|nr:deoxyribonuclease IV [Bacillus sp. 31A1R]MDZ5473881.1 deoxyribonuclease IV [Bacillus sp. 31A1R]
MKFGCHVSIRHGYLGAAKYAHSIGANCYQYFPKNPRSLSVKEFNKEDAKLCKEFCLEHHLSSIAHTPYPTSLTPSDEKKEATIESLINDLEIADACGSIGVVVHYGSHFDATNPLAGYQMMIEMLNTVLENWEGKCLILLENTAGKPGTMGTTLEELVQVRTLCEQPNKIGFCLDTCHAFSSSIWTGENHEELFSKGKELDYWSHLKAIHLNNSKYPSGSGKDRHENIFKGKYIAQEQFNAFITSPILKNIPFILETPSDEGVTHGNEIQQLKETWGGA